MSRTDSAKLSTLPVEILHRTFDDLDATTVLLSVRNVCQRLRVTVDTYNLYKLDLRSISKLDFHRLLALIHPQHVTDLSLTDRQTTPGQIDIGLFTQLRSLTLLKAEGRDLCLFLKLLRRRPLTSFTIKSKIGSSSERNIWRRLLSTICQRTLLRLELLDGDICGERSQIFPL